MPAIMLLSPQNPTELESIALLGSGVSLRWFDLRDAFQGKESSALLTGWSAVLVSPWRSPTPGQTVELRGADQRVNSICPPVSERANK